MAINTQVYQLDIVPNGAPLVVNVHQGDLTQRVLTFQLYSSNGTLTIPSGATASIEGIKPDGNAFAYVASISGTTVTATVRAQMVALAGDIPTQIKVLSGSSPVYAANFILRVQEDVTANADVSDTEIPSLVAQAQAAAQAAEQAAQDIDANWFINGVKTTPIDTYATTSKLTDGAINELKGRADTNASGISTNADAIATLDANAWKRAPAIAPTDMNETTAATIGRSNILVGSIVGNLPDTAHSYHVLAFGLTQYARQTTTPFEVFARNISGSTWQEWYPVSGRDLADRIQGRMITFANSTNKQYIKLTHSGNTGNRYGMALVCTYTGSVAIARLSPSPGITKISGTNTPTITYAESGDNGIWTIDIGSATQVMGIVGGSVAQPWELAIAFE